MRVIGLEPTRLAAPDPKSGTSTNFATPAKIVTANIGNILNFQRAFSNFPKKASELKNLEIRIVPIEI